MLAPSSPCSYPGCRHLRPCPVHGKAGAQFDRPSREARGYDRTWRKLRLAILARDKYLCQICLQKGLLKIADAVDHKIPISQRPDLRLDPDNLQACCTPCNSRKARAGE